MKCINKFIAGLLTATLCVGLCGCTGGEVQNKYEIYADTVSYGILDGSSGPGTAFFTDDICIPVKKDKGTKKVESGYSEGAGLFNVDKQEVLYAKNINEKMYPASTTKILTAYVAMKYGDLDQEITVSSNALNIDSDSSVAHLAVGDVMTLRQLLYGLMLRSGNDAAVAIAEGVSGSVEEFVELMNDEAKKLGATKSHFVTPHGLHDENHYTTIYDMYLITNAAIQNPELLEIMQTVSYEVKYTGSQGQAKSQGWANTCQYFNGKSAAPEGFTIIGAKTGTTGAAGYCLVTVATNEAGDRLINIVYKSGSRWSLYYLMNQVYDVLGR